MSSRGGVRTRPSATPRQARATSRGRSDRSRRTPAKRRRLGLKGRLAIIASAVLFVTALGLGYFSPLLAVRTIEIDGNVAVDSALIETTLAVPDGVPLPRVDTNAAASRVAEIAKIARVRVQRSYPSTVRVTVEERVPVVFFDAADGTHLMDASAVDYAVEPPPPGVVRLVVGSPSFGNLETRAALAVLESLPQPLRVQVARVDAPTISGVTLTLLDGRVVVWGSVDDADRKGAVALPLLTQPGTTYDVSSPDLPTIK